MKSNILLVHDWLTGLRGGEKCLEVLCRHCPQARILTLLHIPGSTSPVIERMQITTSFLQHFPGVGRYYRWLLPLMPLAVESLGVPRTTRLVVSFSHAVAKSVRVPPGVAHVCYCFTPMRYAWVQPEEYLPLGGSWPQRLFSLFGRGVLGWLRSWDRRTAQRVSHFVAISRTVADRIAAYYGRESVVIYPPVDTEFYTPAEGFLGWSLSRSTEVRSGPPPDSPFIPPRPGPEGSHRMEAGATHGAKEPRSDYYLCVSALVPYKRIDLAMEACRRLGRRLVVIGDGPERRRLERLAGPGIQMLGWVDAQTLRERYRQARALLFPALEDFGIVPVESQACGCPVIAYGEGGGRETVLPAGPERAGTGILFPFQNVDSLCRAIQEFEAHPEWFDRQLARGQAERFCQARFERELLGYLEEVLSGRAASDRRGC